MNYDPDLYSNKIGSVVSPLRDEGLVDILRAHLASHPPEEEIINENGEAIARPLLIVDFGCGPGNSAQTLAKAFPSAAIVGLDVDLNMVAYANENKIARCQFYVQDLDAAWDAGWSEELKMLLGGKVDAIFTSYAMHWILDFDQLANSVAHLLRPNERSVFVGNLICIKDISTQCVSEHERRLIHSLVTYPSEKKFASDFLFAFRDAQFHRFELIYETNVSFFPEDYFKNSFVKVPLRWFNRFVNFSALETFDIDEGQLDEIIKRNFLPTQIYRVITPPALQVNGRHNSSSPRSSSSSSAEESIELPLTQVEVHQPMWIFKIVKSAK